MTLPSQISLQEDEAESVLPLSALQHYVFCPRQCALIHVERLWVEDAATAEGRLLHERADTGKPDRRQGVRTVRALPLRSLTLGVAGRADVVEFRDTDQGIQIYPVEYKRGRPKRHRADEVQLCAQAMCLEEMFEQPVTEGALFYMGTRRRLVVRFDSELRALTTRIAHDARAMVVANRTPPPVATRACRKCSLLEQCQPDRLEHPPAVARWLASHIGR